MLPFQRAAVTELMAEDGLLVGAPGLGLGAAVLGGLCELRAALARAGAAAQTHGCRPPADRPGAFP